MTCGEALERLLMIAQQMYDLTVQFGGEWCKKDGFRGTYNNKKHRLIVCYHTTKQTQVMSLLLGIGLHHAHLKQMDPVDKWGYLYGWALRERLRLDCITKSLWKEFNSSFLEKAKKPQEWDEVAEVTRVPPEVLYQQLVEDYPSNRYPLHLLPGEMATFMDLLHSSDIPMKTFVLPNIPLPGHPSTISMDTYLYLRRRVGVFPTVVSPEDGPPFTTDGTPVVLRDGTAWYKVAQTMMFSQLTIVYVQKEYFVNMSLNI